MTAHPRNRRGSGLSHAAASPLSAWIRTHQRWAILIYLGALACILALIVLDLSYLRFGERLAERRIERWGREVSRGEDLVHAGRFGDAVDFLTRLDRNFPARSAKHRLSFGKERLLVALASAYEGAGHPGRARETLRRAVAFDPRNYQSQYRLGTHLLRQGRDDEAEEPLRAALAILPSHLDSIRALTGILFEGRRFREVVDAWGAYVDAVLFAELTLELAGQQARLHVPVDGRFRRVVARLPVPAGASGHLVLRAGESRGYEVPFVPSYVTSSIISDPRGGAFPIELGEVVLTHPLTVGLMSEPSHTTPLEPSQWRPQGMIRVGPHLYSPTADHPELTAEVPGSGLTTVALNVRLPKTVDESTWQLVERSHRALSDQAGLDVLRRRLVIIGRAQE